MTVKDRKSGLNINITSKFFWLCKMFTVTGMEHKTTNQCICHVKGSCPKRKRGTAENLLFMIFMHTSVGEVYRSCLGFI